MWQLIILCLGNRWEFLCRHASQTFIHSRIKISLELSGGKFESYGSLWDLKKLKGNWDLIYSISLATLQHTNCIFYNCDFVSYIVIYSTQLWFFFLIIVAYVTLRVYLAIAAFSQLQLFLIIVTLYLTHATSYLPVVTLYFAMWHYSHNCDLKTHNYDFIPHGVTISCSFIFYLQDFISCILSLYVFILQLQLCFS